MTIEECERLFTKSGFKLNFDKRVWFEAVNEVNAV